MRKILLLSILMSFGMVGYSKTNNTITNSVEVFQFDIFGSIYFLSEYSLFHIYPKWL